MGEPEEMDQMDKEDKMEKEDSSCTCCGSLEHETEQCALIDLTCELCGMPGHIEKMCLIQVPKTEAGTLKWEDEELTDENIWAFQEHTESSMKGWASCRECLVISQLHNKRMIG